MIAVIDYHVGNLGSVTNALRRLNMDVEVTSNPEVILQADGVIFKKTHNAGLTPSVAKVSAGAADTVKCAAVTNLTRTAQDLKKRGYWIIGADMDGVDYRSLKYDFNAVLVIGNEGKGISRLLQKECDYVVSLPMEGKISSLNASVSAGILMYQIWSSRNPL